MKTRSGEVRKKSKRFSGGDDATTLGKLCLFLYFAKLPSFDLLKTSKVETACEQIFFT